MAILLHLEDITKSYGGTPILSEIRLSIREKQKIGIVGRNGAGKTTLLKLIIGSETPDTGTVQIMDNARLGYLTQQEDFIPGDTVLSYLLRVSDKPDWQCAKTAAVFDLKGERLEAPVETLSAGYRMRVRLSGLLLKDPNLLLLDEPTNYLDLSTQLLLESFLRSWRGAFLVISHDREFIKNTCEETLEVERGKITLFPGPLEAYFSYKRQTLQMMNSYNKKVEREIAHLQTFVDRFRAQATKASQAQSKLKQIARLKTIDIDTPLSTVRILLPPTPEPRGLAYRIHELSIGYNNVTVATGLSADITRGEHLVIVGDNGQGKSTLLQTIAGTLPPTAGYARTMPMMRIAYYDERTVKSLRPDDRVLDYLRRTAAPERTNTEVLAMAGDFLFRDHDLKKSISVLSGGERSRLALAGILLGGYDIYLLDEPTNHLDLETVEALGEAIHKSNLTILCITHNRTFAHMIAQGVIEVRDGRIKRYHHSYDEYVYHLKQTLAVATNETEEKEEVPTVEETSRAELHARIKEEKRTLRDIEHSLADLEKEEHKLHALFLEHPTKHFPQETKRLREVETIKKTTEDEWLKTSNQIERWQQMLTA